MIQRDNSIACSLRIAGKDYTITSTDQPEHVRRAAIYADRRIMETAAGGFVNRENAAVIAALHIADELLTAQDDNTRLRRELMLAKQEIQQLKHVKNL